MFKTPEEGVKIKPNQPSLRLLLLRFLNFRRWGAQFLKFVVTAGEIDYIHEVGSGADHAQATYDEDEQVG